MPGMPRATKKGAAMAGQTATKRQNQARPKTFSMDRPWTMRLPRGRKKYVP